MPRQKPPVTVVIRRSKDYKVFQFVWSNAKFGSCCERHVLAGSKNICVVSHAFVSIYRFRFSPKPGRSLLFAFKAIKPMEFFHRLNLQSETLFRCNRTLAAINSATRKPHWVPTTPLRPRVVARGVSVPCRSVATIRVSDGVSNPSVVA